MKLFLLAVFLSLTSILSPVRLQVIDEIVLDVRSAEDLLDLTQTQFEELLQGNQGIVARENIHGNPQYRRIATGRELFEAIQTQEHADKAMGPVLHIIRNPERYSEIEYGLRGSAITLTEDGKHIQVSFPGDPKIFSIDVDGEVPNDAAFLKFWLIKELSNGNLEIPPGLM